jgi:hypothetical protein
MFEQAGFDELAFVDSHPFGVGANRLRVSPQPFQAAVYGCSSSSAMTCSRLTSTQRATPSTR